MREKKQFLREKFIEFQLKIAELSHVVCARENLFSEKEKEWYLNLFETLDAFENLDETICAKEANFDKTTRLLSKNIRSINKKLIRLLKSNDIVKIEFPKNKAVMGYCKIVGARQDFNKENETILDILKNGYINKKQNVILRKAEVITVLNN